MAYRVRGIGYHAKKVCHFTCKTSPKPTFYFLRTIVTSTQCLGSTVIKMPALSPTMTQGTIQKWYKQEGEAVSAGDILCDIETDKAVVSFEVDDEGILAKIVKPSGSEAVALGTVIAMMVEEGDDWQNVEVPVEDAILPTPDAATDTPATHTMPAPAQLRPDSLGIGPAVRSLLDIYQLHAVDIPASGPNGRLLKGDVLQYIANRGLKPAPPPRVPLPAPVRPVSPVSPVSQAQGQTKVPATSPPAPLAETEDFTDVALTNMRKVIAKRLTQSKSNIPHSYTSVDCNMNEVLQLRKKLAADGVKVSVNDFIIKASSVALESVPEVNAMWMGETTRLLSSVDISVAVATDNGLITPIVTDVPGKGLQEISEFVRSGYHTSMWIFVWIELAGRARLGKLQPHEFQGGSFTISNLGMFGITEFTAVINPPQACILAIGGSRLLLSDNGEAHTQMTVQMSSDARVVDDFTATRFLSVFKETLECPMLMLSPRPHDAQSSLPDLSKLFAR